MKDIPEFNVYKSRPCAGVMVGKSVTLVLVQRKSTWKQQTTGMMDDTDRYSVLSFEHGPKKPEPPPPTLDDYITVVLADKWEPHTSSYFVTGLEITRRLLGVATFLHPLYRKYFTVNKAGTPDIIDFRALDNDVFQCLVPLKRAIRPDSFEMRFHLPDVLPGHRLLVGLSDRLMSVDRMQVFKEWGHCLDRDGLLRPDFVLQWFNNGLASAVEILQEELDKSVPGFRLNQTQEDTPIFIFKKKAGDAKGNPVVSVNIIPVIPITEIPRQVRIVAPIPRRRPFGDFVSDYVQQVHDAVNIVGENLFFLEARMSDWIRKTGYHPSIVCSWGINVVRLEERTLQYISGMGSGKHIRDVVRLIDKLKHARVIYLVPINNRVIVNAIFYQHQKSLGRIKTRDRWFLLVIDTILNFLKQGNFPAFFQNKLNLFANYNPRALAHTADGLQRLLNYLIDSPQTLYIYAGLRKGRVSWFNTTGQSSSGTEDKGNQEKSTKSDLDTTLESQMSRPSEGTITEDSEYFTDYTMPTTDEESTMTRDSRYAEEGKTDESKSFTNTEGETDEEPYNTTKDRY